MPCLILTGHPSVGKTTLAEKIKEHVLRPENAARYHISTVVIVNESTACPGLTQAQCYLNSHNEKKTRGSLKARFDQAVVKSNTKNNSNESTPDPTAAVTSKSDKDKQKQQKQLVILDSLNYIKGFRYELFCISKAAGEQHGVVWVLNDMKTAQRWNQARNQKHSAAAQQPASGDTDTNTTTTTNHLPYYTDQSMEELIQRFEPPDERNRWDKPLYKINMLPSSEPQNEITTEKQKQQAANDTKGAKSSAEGDILEKSVYNMHKLSDVMGNDSSPAEIESTAANLSQDAPNIPSTNPTTTDTTVVPKKKTFKGFKRAAKSAKPVKAIMVGAPNNGNDTKEGNNDIGNNLANDTSASAVLYPKNFLFSTRPSEEPLQLPNYNNDTNDDDDSAKDIDTSYYNGYNPAVHGPRQNSQKQALAARLPKPDPNSSVDEQISVLLDSFLLHVQPLKEGTSTQRPVVAGSANVMHEMDAITRSVCDAIVQGQTLGTATSGQIFIPTGGVGSSSRSHPATAQNRLFLTAHRSLPTAELQRLRRQYLRWVATNPPDDCDTEHGIAKSFVTYIEAQL